MAKLVKKTRKININTFVWNDKKNPSKGGKVVTKVVDQEVLVEKGSSKDK